MQGNEEMLADLGADLAKEQSSQAFLLHGPTGCGKTTLGRIIAREVGCIGNDFRELDSASFARGIDTIREIRRQSAFYSMEGPCRVWLLDECHKLSNDAQHALLKALEDPPSHVYYILSTTDPQKLLPTIRGRCAQFQVRLLDYAHMMRLLRNVVKQENEALQKTVLEQIVQDAQGHARDALQILEKVLNAKPERRLEAAQGWAEHQSQTIELCRALLDGSPWKKIALILEGLREEDVENIRRAVLGYCTAVLLKEESDRAGIVMEEFAEPFYSGGFPRVVFACYSVVRGGDREPF